MKEEEERKATPMSGQEKEGKQEQPQEEQRTAMAATGPEAEKTEEADTKQRRPTAEQEAGESERAPAGRAGSPPPAAGPATRQLARKLGVDLQQLSGSGPHGRITQEDVVRAHEQRSSTATQFSASPPPLPDFTKFGPVERQRLNKITRTAMKNLNRSWTFVPHVTQHDMADITGLEHARRRYLESEGKSGPKITLTAVAVKAVGGDQSETWPMAKDLFQTVKVLRPSALQRVSESPGRLARDPFPPVPASYTASLTPGARIALSHAMLRSGLVVDDV